PGLHLNDPVSGDEFLGLGEGAVDDSRELDAGALGARLEPGAIEEYAGFHQLLVVLADRGKEIFARHDACFRVLAGLHNHHESHGHVSFNFYVERGTAKSTRRIVCLTWLPPWGRRGMA